MFTRGEVDRVEVGPGDQLRVLVRDSLLGDAAQLPADLVVLATGMVPNSADGEAIRELVEEHGEAFKEALLDPLTQSPTTNTLILLNGVEINNIKGIDTPLSDGDHIVLIPVTHGG